jgi:hypothetical protein
VAINENGRSDGKEGQSEDFGYKKATASHTEVGVGVGSGKTEMDKCADGFVQNNATRAQDFLELGCGFAAPICGQMGFSMHVHGIHRRCERTGTRYPSSYGAAP